MSPTAQTISSPAPLAAIPAARCLPHLAPSAFLWWPQPPAPAHRRRGVVVQSVGAVGVQASSACTSSPPPYRAPGAVLAAPRVRQSKTPVCTVAYAPTARPGAIPRVCAPAPPPIPQGPPQRRHSAAVGRFSWCASRVACPAPEKRHRKPLRKPFSFWRGVVAFLQGARGGAAGCAWPCSSFPAAPPQALRLTRRKRYAKGIHAVSLFKSQD